MTIKGPNHWQEDSQEQTIRPLPKKTEKAVEPVKTHTRSKSSTSKAAGSGRTRSPSKSHFNNKFELPSRPDLAYREHSVDDFSDLFVDNDSVFTHKVNQAVKKVQLVLLRGGTLTNA